MSASVKKTIMITEEMTAGYNMAAKWKYNSALYVHTLMLMSLAYHYVQAEPAPKKSLTEPWNCT